MKGPYERLKHDLRRFWECPECRHRVATPGDVTSVLCRCQENVEPRARRWMRLLEASPGRAKTAAAPPPAGATPATDQPIAAQRPEALPAAD